MNKPDVTYVDILPRTKPNYAKTLVTTEGVEHTGSGDKAVLEVDGSALEKLA